MTLWLGLGVWQDWPHPCGRLSLCCGLLAPPISVKTVNRNRRCAYNVTKYPPLPLINDIHDPVVGIRGVAALITPLWSIESLLWFPSSSHLRENR